MIERRNRINKLVKNTAFHKDVYYIFNDSNSYYQPCIDYINIGLSVFKNNPFKYKYSDEDIIEYINNTLEHEHIHRVITKIEGSIASKQFDLIAYKLFSNSFIELITLKLGCRFKTQTEIIFQYGLNLPIELYHYTNIDNLKYIDPKFYGNNSYTPKNSITKRSYYYTNKKDRELFFLGCMYRYTVCLSDIRYQYLIYDIDKDTDKIYNSDKLTFDGKMNKIKRKGYIGIQFEYNNRKVICLFYKQKVIKKEVLI